jgi:hypothetical protein
MQRNIRRKTPKTVLIIITTKPKAVILPMSKALMIRITMRIIAILIRKIAIIIKEIIKILIIKVDLIETIIMILTMKIERKKLIIIIIVKKLLKTN